MLRSHRLPFSFHLTTPTDDAPEPGPIDYRPAYAALRALIAWGCEIARARSPEADDRAAIDRVERSATLTLACQRACCLPPDLVPSQADMLITASALIDAFALEVGGPALGELIGPAYAAIDWAMRSTPPAAAPGIVGQIVRIVGAWVPRVPRGPRVVHAVPANDNAACPTCRGGR